MSSANKFFLGINLWDIPTKAYYDDVALWKNRLASSDVAVIYQAELEGKDITELTGDNIDTGVDTPAEEKNTGNDRQTTNDDKQTTSDDKQTTNNDKQTMVNNTNNNNQSDNGNSISLSAGTKTGNQTTAATTGTKLKSLKLSSVKAKKGQKKITGKVSVSKAVVKIKVGNKKYKKATVKGKKFTLKTSKLKKKTKIIIVVTKKGYNTLKKTYKVK